MTDLVHFLYSIRFIVMCSYVTLETSFSIKYDSIEYVVQTCVCSLIYWETIEERTTASLNITVVRNMYTLRG